MRGGAFWQCNLKEIYLPDSIATIGDSAFFNNQELRYIKLPKNLKKIDVLTFSGCSSLTEIIIPDGVTNIESAAFADCTSLKHIEFPKELEYIDISAFSDTKWYEELPNGPYYINNILCTVKGDYAFSAFIFSLCST